MEYISDWYYKSFGCEEVKKIPFKQSYRSKFLENYKKQYDYWHNEDVKNIDWRFSIVRVKEEDYDTLLSSCERIFVNGLFFRGSSYNVEHIVKFGRGQKGLKKDFSSVKEIIHKKYNLDNIIKQTMYKVNFDKEKEYLNNFGYEGLYTFKIHMIDGKEYKVSSFNKQFENNFGLLVNEKNI